MLYLEWFPGGSRPQVDDSPRRRVPRPFLIAGEEEVAENAGDLLKSAAVRAGWATAQCRSDLTHTEG